MSKIVVYRNGIIEARSLNGITTLKYKRTELDNITRVFKDNMENSIKRFKKVIDTEGF